MNKNEYGNRIKVYNAIYGSDIFNQLPPKKEEKITYNYYDDNYNDFKNNKSLKDNIKNITKYKNKKKKFNKNSSSPNFFKTTYEENFSNKSDERFFNQNIKRNIYQNEIPKEYYSRRNKIESLKSNIFNDREKQKQNKKIDNSYKVIIHNDWNTNLDWRNAKSELIFYNDNLYPQYDNSSNNRINELKREKMRKFYHNKK